MLIYSMSVSVDGLLPTARARSGGGPRARSCFVSTSKRHAISAAFCAAVVVGVGARDRTRGADWGGYTVDEAALRHGAGVEKETDDPKQAYARFRPSEPTRYREGSLADLG